MIGMKIQRLNRELKISIVTPNYNYGQYIEECILSVLNQDYNNWEHLIVDDGSTDNSVDIINKYVAKYPEKIKLICQENKGQTAAINVGLKNVTGDIIGWINSDDYYIENVFKKIMYIFQNNPDVDIIFGDVNVVDLSGRFIYRIRHFEFNFYYAALFGFSKSLTSNAVFWRKSVQQEVGLLDPTLKVNMDGEFFSRLCRGRKLYFLKEPLANFRKQVISIAGKYDQEWRIKVKKEVAQELEKSLNFLRKEKKKSLFCIFLMKVFYKIKYTILKIVLFHYQNQFIEKLKYRYF